MLDVFHCPSGIVRCEPYCFPVFAEDADNAFVRACRIFLGCSRRHFDIENNALAMVRKIPSSFLPPASNSVDVFPAFRRFCEQAPIIGQGFFVRYMSLQSFLRSNPLPLSVVHRMLLPGFVSIRQQVLPAVSPIRNVSVAGCTRNQPRFFVTDPEESLFAHYPSWICLFPLV